jgi:hypothetical protein
VVTVELGVHSTPTSECGLPEIKWWRGALRPTNKWSYHSVQALTSAESVSLSPNLSSDIATESTHRGDSIH